MAKKGGRKVKVPSRVVLAASRLDLGLPVAFGGRRLYPTSTDPFSLALPKRPSHRHQRFHSI